MATNSSRNNGSPHLRDRIARVVFSAADSLGISNREVVERVTEQVIQRLEQTYQSFPGMEGAIPESRLRPAEIQSMVKLIIAEGSEAEGSEMEVVIHPTESKRKEQPAEDRRVTPLKKLGSTKAEPAGFSENAMRVLEKRYLKTDSKDQVETPQDMFHRVAHNIASAELNYDPEVDITAWEEKFYRAMANLDFLPNSPTLMNAGRELQQLSACFVLPIEDSMECIFDAIKYTALIHKSGGGTGFSFSRLRPEGDMVGSTGKFASGPVSFMKAFDAATDVIKQGGMRRGANMAILNVNHPDIEQFITAKENGNTLTNFNLSVAATGEFIKAVVDGTDYDLINPRDKSIHDKLNARELFDKIVDLAWRTGDPGLVFIDRMNDEDNNPTPHLGKIESTNPCGEQPLLPYESCNLGSINLSRMLDEGKPAIDYDKLAKTVTTAVRFLDNVIDKNSFPIPEIEKMTQKTRKIGLGVMGFADMLIKLGIPYDSDDALRVADELMKFINQKATETSMALAEERGVFPSFEGSVYDVPGGHRVRNATRTTIAPTGTLSIIAGCSSSIEPLFALSYVHNILDGDKLVEVNPLFEEVAKREGFYSEELMKELAKRGSIKDMDIIPEDIRRFFVTAHDISPEWHVRMQAAFQKSTNNAVSKTINFPHSATREDVAQAYMLAYTEGCKGITIYRDRSKDRQVLSLAEGEKVDTLVPRAPRRRARTTRGVTEKVATGCGNIYVTVNSDEHGVCEVFSSLGKAGGCASAQLEAICRLISLALRSGVDVTSVVKHLRGIRCPAIAWEQGHAVLSCPDAIGSVLERQLKSGDNNTESLKGVNYPQGKLLAERELEDEQQYLNMNVGGQCPECGGMLVYQEGCHICHACGYTKCS
ncbi:MAG TPA: vitamin B12-dependent ribonucleotide reductase [Dehalococcoidia bacterium]|nr:vitamin B12-dependent ribonucleotide reductase [Dehalococcoidia bacterium]